MVKTIKPELATHFESNMIVLEKWVPEKPISAIYYDGNKMKYFVKRFMIDNPNKEESFITEHPKSQLEIVATDYRPMAEIIFSKRSLENIEVNLEEFISVKGIKAIGNQLTTERIKQVNLLESLPYEAPEVEDVEVNEEEIVDNSLKDESSKSGSSKEDGQITMF